MRRSATLLLLVLLSACSSESSPTSASGSAGNGGGGAAAGAPSAGGSAGNGDVVLHGGVVVTLHPPSDTDGYTTAIGRFFDGAQPEILALEPRLEQAECTLFVPKAPFCNVPCAPAVCTSDDVCTDYPMPRAVGTLKLDGLGAAVSMEPTSSLLVYQSPSLAYPPCEPGAPVSASATGVALQADCIAPLTLLGPDPLPIVAGSPLHLSWLAADDTSHSRLRIKLDVSHHGGSKGEIDCEVPDTGSYDIPAAMLTELLGLGLAGFPTINLNRVALGADVGNPHLSLVLSSDITRAVDTGIVSCVDATTCPDGQSCLDGGICG